MLARAGIMTCEERWWLEPRLWPWTGRSSPRAERPGPRMGRLRCGREQTSVPGAAIPGMDHGGRARGARRYPGLRRICEVHRAAGATEGRRVVVPDPAWQRGHAGGI